MNTDNDFKSIYAKQLSKASEPQPEAEDFQFIPAEMAAGKIVKADFEKLLEFEEVSSEISNSLDAIASSADANLLVDIADKIAPYREIAEKYSREIQFARASIGKRLPLVKSACESLDKAVEKVAGELYAKFDDRQREIASINDLPKEISTVIGIRNEVDSISESYRVLSDRFSSKVSKPEIDSYLKLMPRMAKVRKELGEIAAMLEQDQSGNGFVDLKRSRKDVNGIIFAGRLKKEACATGYKEGVVMCAELKKQIDQYIKEFPKVQQEMSWIEQMHAPVEQVVSRLESISEPDESSAKALQIAQNLLFIKGLPPKPDYAFLQSKYSRLAGKVDNAIRVYKKKSSELCDNARKKLCEINSLPEPLNITDVGATLDLIQASMPRVRSIKSVFDALNNKKDSEECDFRLVTLQSEYDSLLGMKKQYAELSAEIQEIAKSGKEVDAMFTNPGMLEIDLDNIMKKMNTTVLVFPESPVFRDLRSAYDSIASELRAKMNSKAVLGLDRLIEFYEQPIMQTGDPVADEFAVQSRLKKINEVAMPALKKTFARQMPVGMYEEKLDRAAHVFRAQLNSIRSAQTQRKELEGKVQLIKSALEKYDTEALFNYSRWPSSYPETPYTKDLAKSYEGLIQHIKGIKFDSDDPVSFEKPSFDHEALRDDAIFAPKKFNLFEYVSREMPYPKNSERLLKLRAEILCGKTSERLSALAQALKKSADSPLTREESSWLAMLKSAFKRDLNEGYLSKAEKLDYVSPEKIAAVRSLFDKYVA